MSGKSKRTPLLKSRAFKTKTRNPVFLLSPQQDKMSSKEQKAEETTPIIPATKTTPKMPAAKNTPKRPVAKTTPKKPAAKTTPVNNEEQNRIEKLTPRRVRNKAGNVWKLVQKLQLRISSGNEELMKNIEQKLKETARHIQEIEELDARQKIDLEENDRTIRRLKKQLMNQDYHQKKQEEEAKQDTDKSEQVLMEKERTLELKEEGTQTEEIKIPEEIESAEEKREVKVTEAETQTEMEKIQKGKEPVEEKKKVEATEAETQTEKVKILDEKETEEEKLAEELAVAETQKEEEEFVVAAREVERRPKEAEVQSDEEKLSTKATVQTEDEKEQKENSQPKAEYVIVDSYTASPSELGEQEETREGKARKSSVYDWTIVKRRSRREKVQKISNSSTDKHMHTLHIWPNDKTLSGRFISHKIADIISEVHYDNTTTLTADDHIQIIFENRGKAEAFKEEACRNKEIEKSTSVKMHLTKVKRVTLLNKRKVSNKEMKKAKQNTLEGTISEGQIVACQQRTTAGTQSWQIILPEFHAEELKKHRRVIVGTSAFYVKNNNAPKRCFKCQSWNHLQKDCQFKTYCANCGSHHDTKKCRSARATCINCTLNNKYKKSDFDCNHPAHSRTCPTYLHNLF